MPRTGMSPKEVRSKAITVALSHMRRHGFERVRLSDIAKDLGVSHAALYSHFEDKAALFDAGVESWLRETDTALKAICQQPVEDLDPLQPIRNWCLKRYQLKRERVMRDPEMYRAFDAAAALRKPFVLRHLAEVHQQLAGLVAKAGKALTGSTPEDQATLLLTALSAFYHPKLMAEHFEENREPMLLRVLDTLLAGIRAQS